MSHNRTGTTKNKGQKDSLDRFYTDILEAQRLLNIIFSTVSEDYATDESIFVEPSAGDGAFVLALEKLGIESNHIIALDVHPASVPQCSSTIHQHDFLDDDFNKKVSILRKDKTLTTQLLPFIFIGNPPFGEQCKLAIDFVNHSLELGRYCMFILPMSFCKETIQKKLNGRIVRIIPIDNINYRVGNERISVPSAFFVIDGQQSFCPLSDMSDSLPFNKIPASKRDQADFAIRRVGGTAGTATEQNISELSSETYYFYVKDDECPDNIVDIINSCDFPEREWSVGPRSLSSKEIAKNVHEKLVELGFTTEKKMPTTSPS